MPRRRLVALLSAVATAFAVVAPAAVATSVVPVPAEDPTGVVASDNVELLGVVPEPGAIGARFRDGLMYVTSTAGLAVYDVTVPREPREIGRLPLPHFENEDVDLGGDILLISNDAAESRGILHVIDISDPSSPSILTSYDMGGLAGVGGPGHTASCVLDCSFAWVSDGGGIMVIDLRTPSAPRIVGTYPTPAGDLVTHDVQVDGDGLNWVVGFGGAAAYRLPDGYDGTSLGTLVAQTDASGASTYISELGVGPGDNPNDFVLHNSMRRAGSDVAWITEEDYTRPGCRGAGSFETWHVPLGADGQPSGAPLSVLDTWETELLGEVAQPSVQCSAHYFDERDGIVAQAWYQQGVRLLDVTDPTHIRQVGYFVDPGSLDWAAYFPPTDPSGRVIYGLDYAHGIEVLEYDRPVKGPTAACPPGNDNGRGRKTGHTERCPAKDQATAEQAAPTVVAPVLDAWRQQSAVAAVAPSPTFEYVCPLPA